MAVALLACCAIGYPMSVDARVSDKNFDYAAYHAEILENSLVQNLQGPEIPKKQIPVIEAYQKNVALALKKRGYDVELMRDRQIVVVTIQASALFNAGETQLRSDAGAMLSGVAGYLKEPDKYKILVVAHSDDTGSEAFLHQVTDRRSDAVADWLVANQVSSDNIVPYGLGADEPRKDNSSRAGRDANRRIEIYLVPGPSMISLAKSGKLR